MGVTPIRSGVPVSAYWSSALQLRERVSL